MKAPFIGAAALAAVLVSTLASAGTEFDATCSDKKCLFKTSVRIGGGIGGVSIQGFCKGCGKAVLIAWTPQRKDKKPKPLAEFWDAKTGEVRQVFKCPKCSAPFVAIKEITDLRHCPNCNKPSLQYHPTAHYDSVLSEE